MRLDLFRGWIRAGQVVIQIALGSSSDRAVHGAIHLARFKVTLPASAQSVLTVLSHRSVDGFVDNHACYARLRGYGYAMVDIMRVSSDRRQNLHKYDAIIAERIAIEQGAWPLVLDPFSVVFDLRALRDVAAWLRLHRSRCCPPQATWSTRTISSMR
ncbi:hypothetical protein BLA39750_06948 [Burkholderia lata]|uniref:Uncharacterized protein n=1 Tax=Burkholderia lata (strain ATCC 17760 / DSM 23089 / LMG 22485 / NCIMB 9086 / R18194 / 383) TaxID=482957 RepID=A0A6P3BE14_BURL3|nr:hypothetical protein [Burkholderia lata]VWD57731.1 hypothetical protein BLA39750_06948 [Burkholderia lata]